MSSAIASVREEEPGNPYLGWIAGTVLILLVLGIGVGLWIHYHGP